MRTEEQKSKDILIYEKKAAAREIVASYIKIRKKAIIISLCLFVVSQIFLFGIELKLYDNEKPLSAVLILAATVIGTLILYFIAGGILAKGLKKFFLLSNRTRKFSSALSYSDYIEEKSFKHTAYEKDIAKAEENLIKAADELIKLT